jgi:hypothetical protein
MKPKLTLALTAVLAAGVVCASPAFAQVSVAEAPAVYRGPVVNCATKYPGSFLDIWVKECWQCPSTHPNRTALRGLRVPKVDDPDACERPERTEYRKAIGPANPGPLPTDCRSGWFIHWDLKCYRCPRGYRRTANLDVLHPQACAGRVIPAAWTRATRKGVEGCPSGSFQNGLLPHCYACPRDYFRNAVIASDLAKVNACSKIEISDAVRRATLAKFNQFRETYAASRDNLGRIANSVTIYNVAQSGFDLGARSLMKHALDGEIMRQTGFHAIGWLVTIEGSYGLGYTHQFGYVMTKDHGEYHCRKVWSNRFTGGGSAKLGIVIELELSKHHELHEGMSELNGWQAGAAYPPLHAGFGLHWNAKDGEMSMALAFGPGLEAEMNVSEYAHTWAAIGKAVPCEKMTWGAGWGAL